MKLSKTSGTMLAATAAAMILSGAVGVTVAKADDAKLGHCMGVNACKGQGFVDLTEEQCKQVGGSKFEMPAG